MTDLQSQNLLVLQYRSSLKKLYWFTLVFLFLIEMIVIRLNLPQSGEEGVMASVFKLVFASTITISIFFRLFIFVRPRIFASYELGEGRLKIQFSGKTKELSLKEVSRAALTFFPPELGGGFKLYFRSGQNFVFLSLLEDSHKILERVLALQPDLMNEKKAQKYLKASRLLEANWNRLAKRITGWKHYPLQFLLVPLVCTLLSGFFGPSWLGEKVELDLFLNWGLLWALISLLLGSLFYWIESQGVLKGTFIDEQDRVQRNFGGEKFWYLFSLSAYYLCLAGSLGFFLSKR